MANSQAESVPVFYLTKEYLTAVGQITVNAALMDHLIDHTIGVLMRTSPTIARRVTDPILSTTRKIALLRDIHDELAQTDAIRAEFHKVYSKLKSAQTNRSKIVHAKWGYRPATKETYIIRYVEGQDEPVSEHMPLRTLQRYGRDLSQAHKALETYLGGLSFVPGRKGVHRWPPIYKAPPTKPHPK